MRAASNRISPTLGLSMIATTALFGCGAADTEDPQAETAGAESPEVERVTQALSTNCYPGPDEISIFQDVNFSGSCVNLNLGNLGNGFSPKIGMYPSSSWFRGMGNDSISSMRIGANVSAKVCTDANYSGACLWNIVTDQPRMLWNDAISSITVYPRTWDCNNPASDQVVVWSGLNFTGACQVLPIGDYFSSDWMGLANDSMTSIRLGSAVQALLCRDSYLGGVCDTLTQSETYLGLRNVGDNQVSSMRITWRPGVRQPVPVP